jgi:tetratricopeptide (TPR) repeat protein
MDVIIRRKTGLGGISKFFTATGLIFLALFSVHAQDAKAPSHAEIAQKFAQALNNQEVDAIANLMDFQEFGKLVTSKLSTSDSIKHAIVEQYQTTDFARTYTNSTFILPPGEVGVFDYKRIISTKDFGNLPMVRVDYETGGHEFMLLLINEKNLIEDFFFASKGNFVSSAVAGATQLILPAQNGFISRLLGNKSTDSADILSKFQKMLALRQQGKFIEVNEILQTFPDEILSRREIIDFNILISQSISDEAYTEALGRLDKYFGDDESTSFMLVDLHVANEDFSSAITSIEKAMVFWGRDSALVHLKANVMYMMGNSVKAMALSKEAIEIEPSYEEPYWTLVTLQEQEKDFEGINKTLALMQQQFDETFTPSRVSEFFVLPDYEASRAYKAALERNSFLP